MAPENIFIEFLASLLATYVRIMNIIGIIQEIYKNSNIMHGKNCLGRQGLAQMPLRPSLVILQFSKTLLKT